MPVDVECAIVYLIIKLMGCFVDTELFIDKIVETGLRPVSTHENQGDIEIL
jgi:hypothetical protein